MPAWKKPVKPGNGRRRWIRRIRCKVREAEKGRIGIETCREAAPEPIRLDLTMPGMNGFGLMAQLRKNEQLKGAPVVAINPMDLTKDDLKRLNGDVIRVLNKQDYDINNLAAAVNRVTGKI